MGDLNYPESNFNFQKMNRILRHRLRNLCAGVKMTVERIADMTRESHPQIPARCDIIKAELLNLQVFTERMDLLFDRLPEPAPKSLFELISEIRASFVKNFPLCSLDFKGPELDAVFNHGSWLVTAISELLANSGTAAGSDGIVELAWSASSDGFAFAIANKGSVPAEIPMAPPQPFNTQQGRHDGLGLSIAFRICCELKASFSIENAPDNIVIVKIKLPSEEIINE